MTRHRFRRAALSANVCMAALAIASPLAVAQRTTPPPVGRTAEAPPTASRQAPASPVASLQSSLQSNPVTAPYRIGVTTKNGRALLTGRVGSKAIYDVAIRTAINSGVAFTDQLIIDTAMQRAMARAQGALIDTYIVPPAFGLYGYGGGYGLAYPSPLLGPYDAPQIWEPPVISYPPYWEELSASRLGESAPLAGNDVNAPAAGRGASNTVEATIDPLGVATLRGTVSTMAERVGVGQKLAQTQGVTEVINLLTVDPSVPGSSAARSEAADAPPPPPIPIPPPTPETAERRPAPEFSPDEAEKPAAAAGGSAGERLRASLARRPALEGLSVQASVDDGIATLRGQVPTAYEAMLVHRTAQLQPGVKSVDDQLRFQVPDTEHPNPLREKGRPEDVEPYLQAQVQRQLGDLAHLDRTRLSGEELDLNIQVIHADDSPRVEAILRSMPLLRGFRVQPKIVVEETGN
ncbi:BON domain-containing protein [Isosphaeraceae bacterium EP7]